MDTTLNMAAGMLDASVNRNAPSALYFRSILRNDNDIHVSLSYDDDYVSTMTANCLQLFLLA